MSSSENSLEAMYKIHRLYCQLDELVLAHSKVYKVESIGGCYLVASGIPFDCSNHAEALISFCMEAVELCDDIEKGFRRSILQNRGLIFNENMLESWKLKIGLHCGPVATGSCGKTRTFFRIFGDAVNTASRFASSANAGEVLVSEEFYRKGLGSPPLELSIRTNDCAVPFVPVERKTCFLKGKGDCICYRFCVDRSESWETLYHPLKDGTLVGPQESLDHDFGLLSSGSSNSNLTGTESPSYGFESKSRFTCSKLEQAQKTFLAVTTLLEIPLEQAFESYKTLSPSIVFPRKGYYMHQIEDSYLRNFVSKFFDHSDGSAGGDDQQNVKWFQHTTTDAVYDRAEDKVENEAAVTKSASALMSVLKRQLFSASSILTSSLFSPFYQGLRFGHARVEHVYQRNEDATVYRITRKGAGWLLCLLVCCLSIYSQGLQDHPWMFALISVAVGGGVVYMHLMLEKFSYLQQNNVDGDRFDTRLAGGEMYQGVTTDNRRTSCEWLEWKPCFVKVLSRFSSWMTMFAWLTIVAFSLADQIVLGKLHPLHSPGETFLHSLALPTVLLSVFQVFPPTSASQFTTHTVGVLFFVCVQYPTWYFHEAPRLLFWMGIYCLLSTAYNATMNGYLQDVKFRCSFVRQCASTHAKFQSDLALTQLYPDIVISRLKRDLRMPFQEHNNDLVVLQADLVGFTSLCSKLDPSRVRLVLDNLYSQFDDVINGEGLWKMDTIGDAYVVVGGLVDEVDRAHLTERILHCAKRIVQIVEDFEAYTRHNVGIRIGVHAGKAVSGVLGRLRPRFHVFGKTMSYVGKLEHQSRRNKIQVSEDAVALYKLNEFHFVERHIESSSTTDTPKTYWLVM
eukprot:gb/GECG01013265.1/.p1 GENE.gb/GECG01013265.1/~~gb/GECG01013265.1/.p1  ORF type:complete len:849 (+),score=72.30 gb/GECG01013265.1/:1-2547(+)